MRTLSLALSLTASAFAEIPTLINYQGRLVDGVGNPIIGKKDFKLDVYDSQTGGTLVYQETLPGVELDEDGAYSFQFGGGESRTKNSVLVATGDGETTFFQKIFEQTPIGEITVTNGTDTFKTGDVPTGEEPFTFTYTASLNRLNLVCNEPPAAGVNFTANFRYAESGIMGALGSAAEHWMEVTIGGEKQEPRQRLVAVPFALRAGVASEIEKSEPLIEERLTTIEPNGSIGFQEGSRYYNYTLFPKEAKGVMKTRLMYDGISDANYPVFSIVRVRESQLQEYELGLIAPRDITYEPVWEATRLQEGRLESDLVSSISFQDLGNPNTQKILVTINWGDGLLFDSDYYYFWMNRKSNPSYGGATVIAKIFTTMK